MSRSLNGMVNADTVKETGETSFMFQPDEIRQSSRDIMLPGAQITSANDMHSSGTNSSKSSLSIKVEEHESVTAEETSVTENLLEGSAYGTQDSVKSSLDGDSVSDIKYEKDSNDDRDLSGDDNFEESSVEGSYIGGECRRISGQVVNQARSTVARGIPGERRRGRRPRGRRGANSSFDYKLEPLDSPGDFGSMNVSGAKSSDSGRGVFVERRKRGRPRGSRGSRGGNTTFECRSPNEVSGNAMDVISVDVKVQSGMSSSSGIYETSPVAVKVGRGALRPGCKSYRGRSSSIGRGYRLEYSETPKWDSDNSLVPVDYDSALSPLTDIEMPAKRQRTSECLSSPLAKRARGGRRRSRGRSRGRSSRASLVMERSTDSDSYDYGTPTCETPDFGVAGQESSDTVDPKSESETEVSNSEKLLSKRRRGRGSRGGKSSSVELEDETSDTKRREKSVTCSRCKEVMDSAIFTYHKLRKHNNCAWREGLDTPLDLDDPKVTNTLLKQALQKRKQLTCEQCGLSRSSLAGFQSHLTFCAKTEGERDALMETCPVCLRRMMPSSLKVHMGIHRQEEKTRKTEEVINTPEVEMDPGEGSSKSSGKIKRAAANRAVSLMQQFIKDQDFFIEKPDHSQDSSSRNLSEYYEENKDAVKENTSGGGVEQKISMYQVAAWSRAIQRCGTASCKNPGCEFKTADKNDIVEHYKSCKLRPKINYMCRMCSFGCEIEEDMQNHVKNDHMETAEENVDEEEEFEESSGGSDEGDGMDLSSGVNKDKQATPKEKKKESKELSTPSEKMQRSIRYTRNIQFLSKQSVSRLFSLQAYITALHWTLEFQLNNYSHVPLYTDWRTQTADWVFLSEKDAQPYLPKARVSPVFARVEVGPEMYQLPPSGTKARNALPWRQLSLFESTIDPCRNYYGKNYGPGFMTLFAGGPVWAQAWCPTSLFASCYNDSGGHKKSTAVSQFLAVSCNKDFDSYHSIGSKPKEEKNIIQIWDFGPLTNSEGATNISPTMALAIAHDFGAVWSLEWCPSGCYDDECENIEDKLFEKDKKSHNADTHSSKKGKFLRRLGLLAAACSDGTVRIFSVPFPSELSAKINPSDSNRDSSEDNSSSATNNDINLCRENDNVEKTKECGSESGVTVFADVTKNEEEDVDLREESEKSEITSLISPRIKEKSCVSAFTTPTSSKCDSNVSIVKEKSGPKFRRASDSTFKNTTVWPVYKPSFVITLVLDRCSDSLECGTDTDFWQSLRLSWSLLGKSHRVLAASFSNGLVALWDMNTTSSLLRVHKKTENGKIGLFLRPYHTFLAHTNAVTALALVTCGAEKQEDSDDMYPRFIVTGGRDRTLKFWDLEDTSAPITTFSRGLITNLVWLTNWLSCVVCNDDGFTHGRSNSKIQAIRQFGFKPCPLLSQNSTVMSVAQSDWLNTISHGTYAGEACILVAHQLLLTIESLKTMKTRRTMAFYTELIDLMDDKKNAKGDDIKESSDKGESISQADDSETKGSEDSVLTGKDPKNSKKKGKNEKDTVKGEKSVESDISNEKSFRTYCETKKRYAILFCDLAVDRENGKLPKDAPVKLQHSERMKEVPLDLYPITAINKMCWNPNLQSFIWLATGHQSGLVRLCRFQKTRNKLVVDFEERSTDKILQVFLKRTTPEGEKLSSSENGNKNS